MQFPTNAERVIRAVNVARLRYPDRPIRVEDVFCLLVGITYQDIDETIEDNPELDADINGIITRCPEMSV